MSDSKLHLMSFAPVPDTKTTVRVVGLPDSLRDALFTLMPPRKEGGYLNTKVLKDDLRCWLDRAVELNPVQLVAVERGDVPLGLTGGHVLDPLHGKPQSLREGARPCALVCVYLCGYAHAQTRRCADAHVHTHADISEEARGRAMRSPHRRATGPAPRGRR